MPSGSLRQVSQPVRDLDRAIEFYRDVLELPFVQRFGPIAFFDLDGVRLMMEAPHDAAAAPAEDAAVLYLHADDILAERLALEARGVAFLDEPHVIFTDDEAIFGPAGEQEWLTFFHDSEGNVLALSSRTPPRR